MNPQVVIEVPASCANLGPGFDSLAVSLDLKLRVSVVPRGTDRVVCGGLGEGELPSDDSNLVWRSLVAACRAAGVDQRAPHQVGVVGGQLTLTETTGHDPVCTSRDDANPQLEV